MWLRIMAVAMTASMAWACATTETAETGSAAGESVVDSAAAGTGLQTDPISSETAGEAAVVVAGTIEDFEVNVGDRVLFGTDRFDLTNDARDVLQRQSQWLTRYPDVDVTIAGHADERGTREYNLALGERRATAVKNYLVALGIDSERIRTISYGKERPVDPGSNEESWAKNRRGVTQIDDVTLSPIN